MAIDLLRFVVLFAILYLAFGVASPFVPAFFAYRGLAPEQIALVLSLSTLIRLASGPVAGRFADHLHSLRLVLAVCAACAGAIAFALVQPREFAGLLMVALLHAAMLAPLTILADALALRSAAGADGAHARFEYGWVRGAGSAAFIAGALAAGQLVRIFGPGAVLACQGILLLLASAVARQLPEPVPMGDLSSGHRGSSEPRLANLLRNRAFLSLMLVAALVLGSHAMHDSFAMIAWNAAGISSSTASVLWSESVAAEVLVFLVVGPLLLRQVHPLVGIGIGAAAAVVRWTVMAQTSSIAALAVIQPLHGLTFALFHLCCMRVLVAIVPVGLAATAQASYAFGIGAVTAILILFSGSLYTRYGTGGFFAMAALAIASLPAIWMLRRTLDRVDGTCMLAPRR